MTLEENRMMKYLLAFSINVPSKSFETGCDFSERSVEAQVWLLRDVAGWQ